MADFGIKSINIEGTHFDIDISFKKTDSFSQKVLLTLNTWKNEFVYDVTKGIDYQAVLSENFSAKSLEAFFLFSLKEQIQEFDTFDNYKLDYNKSKQTANISFTAYSKTGESVKIDSFAI
jgi:hypothetical protein